VSPWLKRSARHGQQSTISKFASFTEFVSIVITNYKEKPQ